MRTRLNQISALVGQPSGDRQAPNGQILIMFALFLTVLLGALGLATDLGFAFAQRRSMQNAADAGALAGTQMVAKSNPLAPISVKAQVDDVVIKNVMDLGTIGTINCDYVNDAGSSLAPCTAAVPVGASGVRVTVDETHPTFFIRVLPGVDDTVLTSATARANVKKLKPPVDGPYLPCGINTERPSGPDMSILIKVDGQWKISPAAVGETFVIHAPQPEDCGAKADRFKGLADTAANQGREAPGWFYYKEGDTAGYVSTDVQGPNGCKAGQEAVNCVAFLPIAIPWEQGNDRALWVVAFAPFYITAPKNNYHYGKLLEDYMVFGKGQSGDWGWNPDYDGPITVRLID